MFHDPLPQPEQIRDYLTSHEWTGESSPSSDVEIFTYQEPADDGQPITVFVPGSSSVLFYPLRVKDVVVTVARIEERSEEAVWHDMLAEKLDVNAANAHRPTKDEPPIESVSGKGKP